VGSTTSPARRPASVWKSGNHLLSKADLPHTRGAATQRSTMCGRLPEPATLNDHRLEDEATRLTPECAGLEHLVCRSTRRPCCSLFSSATSWQPEPIA
jgi:hypothetical protein